MTTLAQKRKLASHTHTDTDCVKPKSLELPSCSIARETNDNRLHDAEPPEPPFPSMSQNQNMDNNRMSQASSLELSDYQDLDVNLPSSKPTEKNKTNFWDFLTRYPLQNNSNSIIFLQKLCFRDICMVRVRK